MKNKSIIISLLFVLIIIACKKDQDKLRTSASFTIVNAISGAGILVPNFQADTKLTYYKLAQQIPAYNSITPFFQFPGHLGIFPLSVSQLSDTLHTVFKGNINIEPSGIYSLFLCGTLSSVDTAFTNDHIPVYAAADSLIGIRFINISQNSSPVSVKIRNQDISIVSSLPYKSVSPFFGCSAKKRIPAVTSYIFEFRDPSAANKLIASYTLTALQGKLGKSLTLALRGVQGGTGANAQAVFAVNNY